MSQLGLRQLFANFLKTGGRQIWSALLQLAIVVIVARVYGATANGVYNVALLLPTLLSTLMALGLAPANAYYLASGKYGLRSVTMTTARIWLVMSALGMLLGAVLVEQYAQRFFPGVPEVSLWLALASFPLLLLVAFAGSLFQGIQDFSGFNLSLSLQPLITLLSVIVVALTGLPAAYLVGAHFVGCLAAAVSMIFLLRRALRRTPDQDLTDYPARTALWYGIRSHLANMIAFLNYRTDLFLVNFLLNPMAAGIYAIAMQIPERLWIISQAVSTVALPRLAQLEGQEASRRAITPLLTRLVLTTTAALAILLAIVADLAVRLVFGPDFRASVLPLIILLPGVVAGSASRILANDIAARGRPEQNFYTSIFTVVVGVIGNVVLIPRLGVNGAALATSIAYLLNLVLRLWMYRRLTGSAMADVVFIRWADVKGLWRALRSRKAQ